MFLNNKIIKKNISTIYRNTIIGLGLNAVYSLTSRLFEVLFHQEEQQDSKTLEKNYALPLIVAANVIDIALNQVPTKKESICGKKVFFSGSQESHENCSVEQKELNYINFAAKVSSICLLVVDYLTGHPNMINIYLLYQHVVYLLLKNSRFL